MQENKRYKYKNYLTKCPICGCPLEENDYDCPACGANLVGYNEEDNRADNLRDAADEMSGIADEYEKLNKKIRKHNAEVIQENAKKEAMSFIIKIVLIGGIVLVVAITFVVLLIFEFFSWNNQISHFEKSYQQVEKYFKTSIPDEIIVNPSLLPDYYIKEEKSSTGKYNRDYDDKDIDYLITVLMGYSKETKKTIIIEKFNSNVMDEIIVVERVFSDDILMAPSVEISWGNSFEYSNFEDEFVDAYKYDSIDEYVLDKHVYETRDNLISKQSTIVVDDLKFYTYIKEPTGNSKYNEFIAIAEIEPDLYYETVISARHIDDIKMILENVDKYLNIQIKRGSK